MLTQEIILKNYTQFTKSLDAYLGQEFREKLIEALGGEDNVIHASFASNVDTGLAYDGAFTHNALRLAAYAVRINDLLPENKKADKHTIVKICLLSHISKCLMFEENDNSYEVTNRGMAYKYAELEGALRVGERSILIATSCGIQFTPTEFEAMRIIDMKSDDTMAQMHSSILSMLVKQANEIVMNISKVK